MSAGVHWTVAGMGDWFYWSVSALSVEAKREVLGERNISIIGSCCMYRPIELLWHDSLDIASVSIASVSCSILQYCKAG